MDEDRSPSEWVEQLRAWDEDGVARVRHGLHQGMNWVLSRYGRRSPRAVTNGISLAMAAAVDADGPFDDVDLAAVAVVQALQRVRLATWDHLATPRWLALRPGHRFVLAVVEVEQVTPDSLSRAIPLPAALYDRAYADACSALGLVPLRPVNCPGWPNVARVYRSREDDATDALLHIERCPRCRPWHADRDERRVLLADLAPAIGSTGIGFALAPATSGAGIGGPSRNVGYGAGLSTRSRGRSTLWH